MLTRASRERTIHQIQGLLATEGTAFLIVPRNIPVAGKVALRTRIQNFVVLTLPSVYVDRKLEIYRLGKETNTAIQRTNLNGGSAVPETNEWPVSLAAGCETLTLAAWVRFPYGSLT